MKLIVTAASLSVAAALLAGCQSSSTTKNPKVIMAAITATPSGGDTASAPITAQPFAGVGPGPVAVTPANRGVPVYIGPKITQTVLAPYENEKGQLFGPQVMYEKVEEGRMNVNALQNPELAYIPQDNLVIPPGMGNPVSAAASQQAAQEAPRLPTDYIDPRDIVVTGLLGKDSNKPEAERMAVASNRRAVFDPDLGWILVPASVAK